MRQRFGSWSFDTDTRRLSRGRVEVHLTPKAFDLLALLVEASPRVVPKSELHERLWPGSFVSDATLTGLVKELRRALADGGDRPLIRTAHRVGYAFDGLLKAPRAPARRVLHWLMRGRKRLVLVEGENLIGRDPDSTVWLDVSGVSRRHARIVVDGESATLDDLGSKNGTLRGGARVTSAVVLCDADRIRVAGVDLVFRSLASGALAVTKTRARSEPVS